MSDDCSCLFVLLMYVCMYVNVASYVPLGNFG